VCVYSGLCLRKIATVFKRASLCVLQKMVTDLLHPHFKLRKRSCVCLSTTCVRSDSTLTHVSTLHHLEQKCYTLRPFHQNDRQNHAPQSTTHLTQHVNRRVSQSNLVEQNSVSDARNTFEDLHATQKRSTEIITIYDLYTAHSTYLDTTSSVYIFVVTHTV